MPFESTVATLASDEAQATFTANAAPYWSFAVNIAAVACPTLIADVASVTWIVRRIGGIGFTTMAACPETAPLVAVSVAVPTATPVTLPDEEMAATALLLLLHATLVTAIGAPY